MLLWKYENIKGVIMKNFLSGLFMSFLLLSCYSNDPKTQYSRLLKSEKSKGTRIDSIFFGYYFGMPRKEFYDLSWKLNREGKVMDGVNNLFIQYSLRNGDLKHPGSMNFFPDFYNEKIFKMRAEFAYDSWAPWNKQYYADSLLPDVLLFFQEWYPDGNSFITIADSTKGTIHVKVDGNRRILIGKYDERMVKAEITDLTVEDELLKLQQNGVK